jgi:nicotinate-nucleotide adenylyltransferase
MTEPAPAPRRRIGLYGGTFNPVHLGHLRAAEEVREGAALAEVRFVVSQTPPHKEAADVAPAAQRLRLVELALDGVPGLRAEGVELERPGPSFTIDTVRILQERNPDADFALILGLDAFREIHTWREYAALLAACDLIVTSRPPVVVRDPADALYGSHLPIAVTSGFCYEPEGRCYRHTSGRRLEFLAVTGLDISSSAIRALLRQGRSIHFLTPAAVVAAIAAQGLYSAATGA